MRILSNNYNVLTIEITEKLTSNEAKVVGTSLDFQVFKATVSKSGIIRVKANVDNQDIFGTLNVNPWTGEDKFECTCVTDAGASTAAVIATVEDSASGMKATVKIVPFDAN